eukprot:3691945-Amphidinium_carterae.1
MDQERLCEAGFAAPSSTTRFNVSLLSGSSASIECSDAATVAQLQRTVRKQLSIGDESYIRLVAGSQLLEPAKATLRDLKGLFGDWTEGKPVELTVVVAELKVKRHVYKERGG